MSRPIFEIKERYVGTGDKSDYSFDFGISNKRDVTILALNASGEQQWSVNGDDTEYISSVTFEANERETGIVNLVDDLPVDWELFLILNPGAGEPSSTAKFRDQKTYTLRRIEDSFDYCVGGLQRLFDLTRKSMRLPEWIEYSDFNMTVPAEIIETDSAGRMMLVNADSNGWELGPDASDIADAQTNAAAAAASATAALLSANNADTSEAAAAASAAAALVSETNAAATLSGAIPKSTGTTKGDIITFTGSATPVRRAAGADNTVPTYWAAATDGLIARADIGARVQKFLSSSGNYNTTYVFEITSGNATAAATYTNNGITYTVVDTIAAGTRLYATGNANPLTSGTLTKASGTGDTTLTFQSYRRPLYLRVKMAGGGGGGGSPDVATSAGTTGGTSTFGSSLLTCVGGGGAPGGPGSAGGAAGTSTLGTGAVGTACPGNRGQPGGFLADSNGGDGGDTALFSGGGRGGFRGLNGNAGITNSGGGGGGGGGFTALASGGGGGSAGSIDAILNSPLATYAYAVGAGGAAGSTGGSGIASGAGAAGYIEVIEYYQ